MINTILETAKNESPLDRKIQLERFLNAPTIIQQLNILADGMTQSLPDNRLSFSELTESVRFLKKKLSSISPDSLYDWYHSKIDAAQRPCQKGFARYISLDTEEVGFEPCYPVLLFDINKLKKELTTQPTPPRIGACLSSGLSGL